MFLGKSFKITFLDMSYRIVLELCTILIFCIYAHKVAHISDVAMLYNTFKVYKHMLFFLLTFLVENCTNPHHIMKVSIVVAKHIKKYQVFIMKLWLLPNAGSKKKLNKPNTPEMSLNYQMENFNMTLL